MEDTKFPPSNMVSVTEKVESWISLIHPHVQWETLFICQTGNEDFWSIEVSPLIIDEEF